MPTSSLPALDNVSISSINSVLSKQQNDAENSTGAFSSILNNEERRLSNTDQLLKINYYGMQMVEAVNNYANNPVNIQDTTLQKQIEELKKDAKAILNEVDIDEFTDLSTKEGIKDIYAKMNAFGKEFSDTIYTLTEHLDKFDNISKEKGDKIRNHLANIESKLQEISNTVSNNTLAKQFESLAQSFRISNQYLSDPRLLSLKLTDQFTSSLLNIVGDDSDDEDELTDPFSSLNNQASGVSNPSSMSAQEMAAAGFDANSITTAQSSFPF